MGGQTDANKTCRLSSVLLDRIWNLISLYTGRIIARTRQKGRSRPYQLFFISFIYYCYLFCFFLASKIYRRHIRQNSITSLASFFFCNFISVSKCLWKFWSKRLVDIWYFSFLLYLLGDSN